MLKRIEVYVDSAVLSFPASLVLFFAVVPLIRGALVQTRSFSLLIVLLVPVIIAGGALSVWITRRLHRATTSLPMNEMDSRKEALVAMGSGLLAVLLGLKLWSSLSSWPFVWMALAAVLVALAVALLVDSGIDLFKVHSHRVLDVFRVVVLLPLAVQVVIAMAQLPKPGSDADIGPWVLAVTVYMLLVAIAAYAWDRIASARTRRASAGDNPADTADVAGATGGA